MTMNGNEADTENRSRPSPASALASSIFSVEKTSTPVQGPGRKYSTLVRATVIVIALAVVLALALGLGLGLGLRSKASSSAQVAPWRLNTEDYNLDIAQWDLNSPPTNRVYNFTLSEIEIAPDGVSRTVLAINGRFPGPLIRANRGDRLLVYVNNQMSNATSIHWHGMFQNGTNWMDGTSGITQCPIPPGGSFLYNFTVDNQYGSYWYHSHYKSQNTDGILGPLIIHAPEEKQAQAGYDYDQVILIQDWYHDLSQALLPGYLASGNENVEPVPDGGLIQGTNFFNCSSLEPGSSYSCQNNSTRAVFSVEQNKRYRYRLINVGAFTLFEFSVDNHTLSVIEADGTVVEPISVHRLQIAVAQRYSVILNANQTASNYWMRAQMNTFCFAADNPVLDPDVRAIISYTSSNSAPTLSSDWADAVDDVCEDLNSTMLVPSVEIPAPPPSTIYAITASFQIGDYALDRAYVNGTSWVMSTIPTLNQAVTGLHAGNSSFSTAGVSSAFTANQYVIDIPTATTVDLLITNFDDGSHPFHLHGHVFWILASSPDQYFDWSTYNNYNTTLQNPMRRDTMTIEAYGWALIRFHADNPGLWALHCHISWHMEAGLLMQFQTRNDILQTWTLPSDVLGLCQ